MCLISHIFGPDILQRNEFTSKQFYRRQTTWAKCSLSELLVNGWLWNIVNRAERGIDAQTHGILLLLSLKYWGYKSEPHGPKNKT